VLTGAGERAFCAGGDLKERDGMTQAEWQAQHELFERAFVALLECTVPVVAAVNGHAFGGGLEMALCCDFIYAVPGARFAQSEVRLGIMPGGMGTQNLPRAVGERRAKELILSARPFSAAEGLEWGLVNRICEPAKLLEEALRRPGSPATGRWRCARRRNPSTTGCRRTCSPATVSRSRPTTGWWTPTTGARACGPSTKPALKAVSSPGMPMRRDLPMGLTRELGFGLRLQYASISAGSGHGARPSTASG
jgi:enoyl-CoA hydratase/carnithine racemase